MAGSGVPGTNGRVLATVAWDPDGAGPAGSNLAAGGWFTLAGTVAANHVVAWDSVAASWAALGSGTDGPVDALAAMPNGDLIAGGAFTSAGGVATGHVARWDGSNWSSLGAGIAVGQVSALCVMPNGDLIVGGYFGTAGGVPVSNIARWDGTNWLPLGSGLIAAVEALCVMPNGDLIAGGYFPTLGGQVANLVARWDGVTWSMLSFGSPQVPFTVEALAVMPNGDLMAGGASILYDSQGQVIASTHPLASWDGASWTGIPVATGSIKALAVLPGGSLVAAGGEVVVGSGTTWSVLGAGIGSQAQCEALAVLPNSDLVLGGEFTSLGGTMAHRLARWNGAAFVALLPSVQPDQAVRHVEVFPNGDELVVGSFTTIGGIAARGLARASGGGWSAFVGSGDVLSSTLTATVAPNGDVIAAGHFLTPGSGFSTHRVERWDGVGWSAIGVPNNIVQVLRVLANGDVVAGGNFTAIGGLACNAIARWDGSSWQPLGGGIVSEVSAIHELPNGDLIVGGYITQAGGAPANFVARWDGASWSPLGAGVDYRVHAITSLPNGHVVVGGTFFNAGGAPAVNVARWDGASWAPLGSGCSGLRVGSLSALPNGDLVAGGAFTSAGGVPVNGIARWNGSTWASLQAPFVLPFFNGVSAIAMAANGDLIVGGDFASTDPLVGPYLARLASTCPATAFPTGLGCAGSGGLSTLTAVTLPWVDATFRSRATGLPATAVVAALFSFTSIPQGTLPLATTFPQAPAGCDVLVAPDILGAVIANGGVADHAAFLPNTPPLVGLTFFHQMVPFELDALGNVVAVTATNRLQLTAGAF
ncbi:MAG: hypothetical protein JNL08_06640 [Planctomycetes bacterium]|nr:hypothetical protein [Planctomycetota bacterium]